MIDHIADDDTGYAGPLGVLADALDLAEPEMVRVDPRLRLGETHVLTIENRLGRGASGLRPFGPGLWTPGVSPRGVLRRGPRHGPRRRGPG